MKTRVLIAEERPDTGERLANAFRTLNCDVCLVYEANEAIVAAPTFQPHVAILGPRKCRAGSASGSRLPARW